MRTRVGKASSPATSSRPFFSRPAGRRSEPAPFFSPPAAVPAPRIQARLEPQQDELESAERTAEGELAVAASRQGAAAPPLPPEGGPGAPLRTQPIVGANDDPLEREADETADRVMRRIDSGRPGAATPRIQRQADGGTPASGDLPGRLARRRGAGEPLSAPTRREMESAFGADLGHVRTHHDPEAARMAGQLRAQAFTHRSDIYFGRGRFAPETPGGKHLLAHELTHVLQQTGAPRTGAAGRIQRTVAPTPIALRTKVQLFGDGTPANPGIDLREFEEYTRTQADWFVEPSLLATDRDDLWELLLRTARGDHILAGVGDLKLADLRGVSSSDWTSLEAFCRASHASGNTVRILGPTAYTLARRIALGATLLDMEAIIPPEVLRITVSEVQLSDVESGSLMTDLSLYWFFFDPHLEETYTPATGARGPEFQRILDLLNGPGIVPFLPLLGRVRNLHRFSAAALTQLVANFADTSRSKPVHLVLHTGHDGGAFQASASLFNDLITTSPNLVLMLEGQGSLAAITAAIPIIASRYGQPDGAGGHQFAQVIIAGHGQARSVELAGSGPPTVSGGTVFYPSESLDLDANAAATNALLDALLSHLDPATARLVFAGCLVGANPVPTGTAQADITSTIAGRPSLATHAETRGTATHGLSPGFVNAARASVALAQATSLTDSSGNLAIQYPFDPDAFASALTYVASGREPEGVLVAAIEVAGSSPVVAADQLRIRQALAARPGWWDQLTRVVVDMALDGVAVGAGIDVARVNTLAHMIQIPFLTRWPPTYNITVSGLVAAVNSHGALAGDLYTGMVGTPTVSSPADADARAQRLIIEQGWLAFGGAREAPLLTFLGAHPQLTAEQIRNFLDPALIASSSPTLFPAAASATPERLRLGLAWLALDPANTDVRAFLDAQVTTGGAAPSLNAAAQAELGGFTEREVLEALGRLTPTTAVTSTGGVTVSVPNANAALAGSATNDIRIEPAPDEPIAFMLGVQTDIWPRPDRTVPAFAQVSAGTRLRRVGTVGSWSAVDHNGRLGFIESVLLF